jgi:hypothetical protein
VSVPCFLLFFCFRKATQEIFLELDETKAKPPIFPEHESKSKAETEGGQDLATPYGGAAQALAVPPGVRPPGPPPSAALPPIYSPQREKPKPLINFPRNLLQAAVIVNARSGGSRSSSRYPAGEGNPCRRPSSSPWSPPE